MIGENRLKNNLVRSQSPATSQIFFVDACEDNFYLRAKLFPHCNVSWCMQKTILVVDDDPLYLELLKDLLDMQCYHTLTARNGLDALQILEQRTVDVIVSDIEMPIMDGIALHQKTLERAELKQIPFIFLTGSEQPHHFRYIDAHPGLRLLRKNEMVNTLLALIADALRGECT